LRFALFAASINLRTSRLEKDLAAASIRLSAADGSCKPLGSNAAASAGAEEGRAEEHTDAWRRIFK
jgi:hypothetical protein